MDNVTPENLTNLLKEILLLFPWVEKLKDGVDELFRDKDADPPTVAWHLEHAAQHIRLAQQMSSRQPWETERLDGPLGEDSHPHNLPGIV